MQKLGVNTQNFVYSVLMFWVFMVIPIILIQIYGIGPDDPECYEIGTCNFFQHPLDVMLLPFTAVFGGFFYIIIWGLLMGILWLRVSNTMVVAIIGLALAVVFQPQFQDDAKLIGYVLLGLAITVALYQIFTIRTHFPTN